MKKTKAQAKISKVMREYKAGELHSGKGGKVVKSKKKQLLLLCLRQERQKRNETRFVCKYFGKEGSN